MIDDDEVAVAGERAGEGDGAVVHRVHRRSLPAWRSGCRSEAGCRPLAVPALKRVITRPVTGQSRSPRKGRMGSGAASDSARGAPELMAPSVCCNRCCALTSSPASWAVRSRRASIWAISRSRAAAARCAAVLRPRASPAAAPSPRGALPARRGHFPSRRDSGVLRGALTIERRQRGHHAVRAPEFLQVRHVQSMRTYPRCPACRAPPSAPRAPAARPYPGFERIDLVAEVAQLLRHLLGVRLGLFHFLVLEVALHLEAPEVRQERPLLRGQRVRFALQRLQPIVGAPPALRCARGQTTRRERADRNREGTDGRDARSQRS